MMLGRTERTQLLELARESTARGLGRGAPDPMPGGPWAQALSEQRASFTTLTIAGDLRGCRGTVEPRRPLVEDVWHNAWASAYDDPRFEPVTADEIPHLAFAISVLSPLEAIAAASDSELIAGLEPGVDGLLLSRGAARATFLPAVWHQIPDPYDFVMELKRKAGWSAGFWANDVKAYRYRTETFAAH